MTISYRKLSFPASGLISVSCCGVLLGLFGLLGAGGAGLSISNAGA